MYQRFFNFQHIKNNQLCTFVFHVLDAKKLENPYVSTVFCMLLPIENPYIKDYSTFWTQAKRQKPDI